MTTFNNQPLDEIVHNRPEVAHWWVHQVGGKPMDENMVHRYLETSPFFDHTTKNGLIFTQAATDYNTDLLVANRHKLEDALRRQIGTEYMIVADPKAVEGAEESLPKGTTGVYVVRKQDRQRVRALDGRMEDELTTLGTYYTVGLNMYQAASVADLIGNRLLHVQRHVNKFYETAAALPSFDPATGGYYWYKQPTKPVATTGMTPGTPSRSREGSVAAGADSQSLRSGSVEFGVQAGGEPQSSMQDNRLLAQSFSMSNQFGDEYMDENPVIGEPGHFTFTSSTAAVKQRKANEEAAAAKAKAELEARSRPTSPKVRKAASPPAIMSEAKTAKSEKERKGGKLGEKIRRKKSKASNLSPTTPGTGPSSSS